MKRRTGRFVSLSLIALVLIAAMIFSITMAENVTPIEVSNVVNTTTDQSLVVSPFTGVISGVQSSVVGVNNYRKVSVSRGYGARSPRESTEQLASTGSGVVIYDKYVLTNYHVVEDASRVSVSALNSDEELTGEVVGYDDSIDIAIIYVEGLELPAAPLGDSDQLQVGEWAICIGNPLAEELRGTVTVGIISALNREIKGAATTDKYGLRTTTINTMIQTDAAINSGNSGGGMFNVLGQLMGIPSMKYTGSYYSSASVEGIGLAIPINSAKPLIEKVLSKGLTSAENAESGESAKAPSSSANTDGRPRLGVSVSTINRNNDYAVLAGVLPAGAIIGEVEDGSPAKAAGLEVDDIIVEVNGNVISSVSELSAQLADKNPGDVLQVKVYRAEGLAEAQYVDDIGEGEYLDFEVTLTTFS